VFHRRDDDPIRSEGTTWLQERRSTRPVATGTLACPSCDAPVSLSRATGPAEPLTCPYCACAGFVRDFLTLGEPSRPARVVVRVVMPGRVRVQKTL
jgi:hypothetical protein